MALTTEQRLKVYKKIVNYISKNRIDININKQELKNAVTGIDNWIDTEQVNYNLSIPEPARTELTAKQKTQLFMEILKKRWEVE